MHSFEDAQQILEQQEDARHPSREAQQPRDGQPRDGQPRDGQPRDGQPRDTQSRARQLQDTNRGASLRMEPGSSLLSLFAPLQPSLNNAEQALSPSPPVPTIGGTLTTSNNPTQAAETPRANHQPGKEGDWMEMKPMDSPIQETIIPMVTSSDPLKPPETLRPPQPPRRTKTSASSSSSQSPSRSESSSAAVKRRHRFPSISAGDTGGLGIGTHRRPGILSALPSDKDTRRKSISQAMTILVSSPSDSDNDQDPHSFSDKEKPPARPRGAGQQPISHSNLSLYEQEEQWGVAAATSSYLTSHSWDPSRAAEWAAQLPQWATEGPALPNKAPRMQDKIRLLGTVKGVLLPCLQNIFGIIMFVRLPWITGLSGVGLSLLIVFMSVACIFLTTMSMSAIASNGHVPAGGPYYMISRSLGKELGVSCGILLYLAMAVSCALYILGAVEILYEEVAPVMQVSSDLNNSRLYGTVFLLVFTLVAVFGRRTIDRFVFLFLACVGVSILSIFAGLFASNRPGMPANEVVGFPGLLSENLDPAFHEPDLSGDTNQKEASFLQLFAIFFPTATGFLAGTNRSGVLRSPSKSIPNGTLSAVAVSSCVYVAFVLLFGTVCTGEFLRTKRPANGLPIAVVAWPHPLVSLTGVLLASSGAALQCLSSGPRLLQALSKDGVIPALTFFTKTTRGEPLRALFLTYAIAQLAVLAGSLDAIAPITTMLYLICYAFINFSTALLSLLRYPNWRPTWRWYHWSSSLLGALLCIVYMFVINYIFALIALCLVAAMYKYIEYRGAQVEWGDGMYALNLSVAQKNLFALERTHGVHAKNWRPQVMAIMDLDKDHIPKDPMLLSFLAQLRKGGGLSIVTTILQNDLISPTTPKIMEEHQTVLEVLMKQHGVRGFSQTIVSSNVLEAKQAAMQAVGIGALRPNSILLAYPKQWRKQTRAENNAFVHVLRAIIASEKVVMILRVNSDQQYTFPNLRAQPFDEDSTMDVYWIMHDGGILTVLPYLLRKSRIWKRTRLRVFCVAQEEDNNEQIRKDLELLLLRYRIDAEAHVVELGNNDIREFAYEKTMRMHERSEMLLGMQIQSEADLLVTAPATATTNTLLQQRRTQTAKKQKNEFMNSSIKLNLTIKQNSAKAALIFLSLPPPMRSQSSLDYLEYLDALTADLPRVLLIKGSGMEVVTAYF